METKKLYVVTITEYQASDNYLDSYTELYADEEQAKARVDEYSALYIWLSWMTESWPARM